MPTYGVNRNNNWLRSNFYPRNMNEQLVYVAANKDEWKIKLFLQHF